MRLSDIILGALWWSARRGLVVVMVLFIEVLVVAYGKEG
jgi:hypothetical protein